MPRKGDLDGAMDGKSPGDGRLRSGALGLRTFRAKKKLSQLEQSLAELGAPSTSAFQSFRDSISRAASMQGEFEKSCRY
jgi:hypothetical protein